MSARLVLAGNGVTLVGDRRILERLPGGGYAYVLLDDAVRIEARYLRREHGHLLHAEVDVRCEWGDLRKRQHNGSLSCADLNLSSQSARKALAKYCGERAQTKADAFDWPGAIDAACLEVIQAERQGADVIVLDDAPESQERDFDVSGIRIPADAASFLIAHGDSMKSLVALFISGNLAARGHRVLYLDWEWSADRHRRRKCRLFGEERLDGLEYLRCRAPLVFEVDRLRRYCDERRIEFIVIDSVGVACDGKLVDDDVAIRFHRALAKLPAALCTAHVPKSSLGPDGKGDAIGPFGSVFFSNLCRTSWLVKKQPGASEDVVSVGLFPQKQNDGDRNRPVGLEFTFGDRILVRNVDLVAVDGLADKMPIRVRAAHFLKTAHGPRSAVEIAAEINEKSDSVYRALKRDTAFHKVLSADGIHRFALIERNVA
jgi:hypothetical protein